MRHTLANHFIKFISILFTIVLNSCSQPDNKYFIDGQAQGTTYHITYYSSDSIVIKSQIDSLLRRLDLSLSTYRSNSIITRFNLNDPEAVADRYFTDVFNRSQEISELTQGVFDITVGPLINAYGFGFTEKAAITSELIDSLREFVGYKKVKLVNFKLQKERPEIMLDFNAIAQGYSVDVLVEYLESQNIQNYLVELGGEVRAKGGKPGESWTVGIEQPTESMDAGKLQAVIKMKDRAMATSGNYRRFYDENGQRYAHIINPFTGYPVKHNLLSATVFAADCMSADAYATAFMVMGLEKSKAFLSAHPELGLDVFFIYDSEDDFKTYASKGLIDLIDNPSVN
jgi:FAD:protein FMN transferase